MPCGRAGSLPPPRPLPSPRSCGAPPWPSQLAYQEARGPEQPGGRARPSAFSTRSACRLARPSPASPPPFLAPVLPPRPARAVAGVSQLPQGQRQPSGCPAPAPCPTPPSALPAPSLCSPARPGLPRACLPLFGSIQALQAGRSMRHAADHAESVACERRLSTEEVLSLLPLVGKKVAWRLHLGLCSPRPSTLPRSARKLASAPRRRRVVSGCCRSGSPSSLLGVCPRLGGWEASQFRAPWLLSWAFWRRLSTRLSEHQARESPSASWVSWALHRT